MDTSLQTILGTDIPLSTRGILYLCQYDYKNKTLTVINEALFDDAFTALNYYANIPNPESQLVQGKTYDELIERLLILHENIKNPEWLKFLGDCL
jgi:hypothetical protein